MDILRAKKAHLPPQPTKKKKSTRKATSRDPKDNASALAGSSSGRGTEELTKDNEAKTGSSDADEDDSDS